MKRSALLPLVALLAAAPAVAQDATPKVSGLLQVWYTQMLSDNLRLNSAATTNGNKYYDLSSNWTENSFVVRRSEIKVSGAVPNVKGLTYEVVIDPSINTSATNPTILQDAFLKWADESGFEIRAGQMKTYQTYEGYNSSSMLIFAERSQLGRVFGDKRDRGAAFGYKFGDADFSGKATLAFFNGMTSANSGKGNDANAQKDFVARLEFNAGKTQKFGVYGLSGSTDQADKGALAAKTFAGTVNVPTSAEILADKDATSSYGAFYVYDNGTWHFDGEAITGKLGRRNPSVGTAGAASREALDQKFLGFYATAAYTMDAHTFALRYDRMNYNQGDKWYTAYNPYTQSAPGVSRGGDFAPKYSEATLGYTYAFNPKVVKAANLKVNYIWRSKNFLAPTAAQATAGDLKERGGDSAVVAFQIAF